MTTKITVIYDNPQDPAAFEAAYPAQLALVKKLPGIRKLEASKVWPREDGSPTPAYRMIDMYFADYADASAARASEEAGALFSGVFALATGGVRVVFAEIEES